MSQFSMRVGGNIKKYRLKKGMTLKQLADVIGLSEATVQKYEAGNIKTVGIELINKIAEALDVSPENITEWESEAYEKYHSEMSAKKDANLLKKYSQLNNGHKKAVLKLIESLIECQNQDKNNSDKNS